MLSPLRKLINYISSHLAMSLLVAIDIFLLLNWWNLVESGNTHQSIVFIIIGAVFNLIIIFMYDRMVESQTAYKYIKSIFGDTPPIDIKDIVNLSNGLNEVVDMILNSSGKDVIDVPIDRLSILWREGGVIKQENVVDDSDVLASAEYQGKNIFAMEVNIPQKTFNNDIVNNFYDKLRNIIHSVADKNKSQSFMAEIRNDLVVTYFLLYLLDYYGDCPSVVNVKNKNSDSEPDNIRVKTKVETSQFNQYDLLSHITLAEHSIRVADKAAEIAKDRIDSYYTILSNVIAALAHDIGKIPNYYESSSYTTYQHPSISANILKNQSNFKKMPASRRNLILNAVEMHHSYTKATDNIVLETLRQADKLAREEEITLVLEGINNNQKQSQLKTVDDDTAKKTTDMAGKIAESMDSENKNDSENSDTPEIPTKFDFSTLEKSENGISLKKSEYEKQKETSKYISTEKITNKNIKNQIAKIATQMPSADKITKEMVQEQDKNVPATDTKTENSKATYKVKEISIVPSLDSNHTLDNIEVDVDFGQFIDQNFLDKMMELIEEDINIVRVNKIGIPTWNAFTYHHEIYVTGYGMRKYALSVLKLNPAAESLYQRIIEEDNAYNPKTSGQKQYNKDESDDAESKRPLNLGLLKFIVMKAKEAGLIETSKIRDKYFGGRFIVKMQKDDNRIYDVVAFYTVFKGDVFRTSFEDLEKKKLQDHNNYLFRIKELIIDPTKKE